MSNIFDALNKGKGEIADSILPLIDASEQPGELQNAKYQVKPVTQPRPASAPKPAVAREADFSMPVRCLPLRIPAPSPLLPFEDGHSPASEQYRILRAKLGQHPKRPRVIVISSPAARDGKTITAVNLAGVLALKNEGKVLLVDADMRRPTIDFQLGLPKGPGLADILTGNCGIEQALVQTQAFPSLYVMPAGTPPANPAELLDTARWPALCTRLQTMFRYSIIDSPPVAALADFDLIQAPCDGTILVIRPDHTNRPLTRHALQSVPKDKFLGVVLNCVPEWFLGKSHHAAYYYYGYEQSKAPAKMSPSATSESDP
jgi:capsular exopolysaccharide synthesis family protein